MHEVGVGISPAIVLIEERAVIFIPCPAPNPHSSVISMTVPKGLVIVPKKLLEALLRLICQRGCVLRPLSYMLLAPSGPCRTPLLASLSLPPCYAPLCACRLPVSPWSSSKKCEECFRMPLYD